MKTRYLTIEREYGSGGTKIARLLSKETGIPCYGSEILKAVSEKEGLPVEDIRRYEETATKSFLYSLYAFSQASRGGSKMQDSQSHVFISVQNEILSLARKGRSIFLGHCASEAISSEKGVVRIFIHCSDPEMKAKRIIKDYGVDPKNADLMAKRIDKRRANYFSANTGAQWTDPKNYDIYIDSATLGIEGCVRVLKGLFD